MPVSFLDDLTKIKKLDSQNMLGSLQLLGKQVEQVWEVAQKLKVPVNHSKTDRIVVLGMGGSALGADVIKRMYAEELRVPLEVVNDYHLPRMVNNKTLVVASSYSGNTEEVISGAKEAKKRKVKLLVITSGGKLGTWAKKNNIPALVFPTDNNPCKSPRMGIGYSIVGQIVLFSKAGLLRLSQKKVKEVVKTIALYDTKYGTLTPLKENTAKQVARKTVNKSIWYIASEHLIGNAHVAANQMNENGKRFAGYFTIPELNHHLLEGMINPISNKKELLFVTIESELYDKRTQKRYSVTKKVLKKTNINYTEYECKEADKLLQVCEVLVFASYLSYYSAILKKIDPTDIPFVDYFKKQMKK